MTHYAWYQVSCPCYVFPHLHVFCKATYGIKFTTLFAVGVDYGVAIDDLIFRPGDITGDISCSGIPIIHDNETELDEIFLVTMSTASPNQLVQDDRQVTVVIIDIECKYIFACCCFCIQVYWHVHWILHMHVYTNQSLGYTYQTTTNPGSPMQPQFKYSGM